MAKPITPAMLAASGSESGHQKAVFCWAATQRGIIPDIERLFAVPNGGYRPGFTGSRMVAEGVKKGVPDILWPVRRGIYIGCAVELKVKHNKTSAQQDDWITFLRSQGWYAVPAVGWHEATQIIMAYNATGITAR